MATFTFKWISPVAFAYGGGAIRSAYDVMSTTEIETFLGRVAHCQETGEWLARNPSGRLWTSYGRTRDEAAAALIDPAARFCA